VYRLQQGRDDPPSFLGLSTFGAGLGAAEGAFGTAIGCATTCLSLAWGAANMASGLDSGVEGEGASAGYDGSISHVVGS
jgi:hypothetical protein